MIRVVDNYGVGALYGTFVNKPSGTGYELTSDHQDAAVAVGANNEATLGTDGDALLGQVVSVQGELVVVQMRGVVRVPYTAMSTPELGGRVSVDGSGKVRGDTVGGSMVLAVDTSQQTVDVLL